MEKPNEDRYFDVLCQPHTQVMFPLRHTSRPLERSLGHPVVLYAQGRTSLSQLLRVWGQAGADEVGGHGIGGCRQQRLRLSGPLEKVSQGPKTAS